MKEIVLILLSSRHWIWHVWVSRLRWLLAQYDSVGGIPIS